ncbi:hypothetical protein TWF730_006021 [Orbilia blumenaviensis]|uniref:Uncharacterized protein n=1 Tax=Orbilia blumenaviensis TaxID=1796055 RepID=A0AAV9VMV9_9PEZI
MQVPTIFIQYGGPSQGQGTSRGASASLPSQVALPNVSFGPVNNRLSVPTASQYPLRPMSPRTVSSMSFGSQLLYPTYSSGYPSLSRDSSSTPPLRPLSARPDGISAWASERPSSVPSANPQCQLQSVRPSAGPVFGSAPQKYVQQSYSHGWISPLPGYAISGPFLPSLPENPTIPVHPYLSSPYSSYRGTPCIDLGTPSPSPQTEIYQHDNTTGVQPIPSSTQHYDNDNDNNNDNDEDDVLQSVSGHSQQQEVYHGNLGLGFTPEASTAVDNQAAFYPQTQAYNHPSPQLNSYPHPQISSFQHTQNVVPSPIPHHPLPPNVPTSNTYTQPQVSSAPSNSEALRRPSRGPSRSPAIAVPPASAKQRSRARDKHTATSAASVSSFCSPFPTPATSGFSHPSSQSQTPATVAVGRNPFSSGGASVSPLVMGSQLPRTTQELRHVSPQAGQIGSSLPQQQAASDTPRAQVSEPQNCDVKRIKTERGFIDIESGKEYIRYVDPCQMALDGYDASDTMLFPKSHRDRPEDFINTPFVPEIYAEAHNLMTMHLYKSPGQRYSVLSDVLKQLPAPKYRSGENPEGIHFVDRFCHSTLMMMVCARTLEGNGILTRANLDGSEVLAHNFSSAGMIWGPPAKTKEEKTDNAKCFPLLMEDNKLAALMRAIREALLHKPWWEMGYKKVVIVHWSDTLSNSMADKDYGNRTGGWEGRLVGDLWELVNSIMELHQVKVEFLQMSVGELAARGLAAGPGQAMLPGFVTKGLVTLESDEAFRWQGRRWEWDAENQGWEEEGAKGKGKEKQVNGTRGARGAGLL